MEILEKKRSQIKDYLSEVESLPNEEGKKVKFLLLIDQLFGSKVNMVSGLEKLTHIYLGDDKKHRFMDAYYGNLVIEFEKSLDASLPEAERQLKEYISGQWNEDGEANTHIAIATDGINWQTYYPSLIKECEPPWSPDQVELDKREFFTLKKEEIDDFYFWLNRLLLREGRLIPSASTFEEDFGLNSYACSDAFNLLSVAFDKIITEPESKLAFETWAKYLRYTYGSFEPNKDLFIKHSYLAAVARLLVWATFSEGIYKGSLDNIIKRTLDGSIFQVYKIENLGGADFYRWILNPKIEKILISLWNKIVNQMLTYDLSKIEQDVLKGVYQQLVDENTRHGLGEYYTPDWLCEKIVDDLIPKNGFPKILDPSCGSGSFLRAVLSHLMKNNIKTNPREKLRNILDSVIGFDINPLAVVISKATYSIALGPLLKRHHKPIQIPVYLADTLFVPRQVRQMVKLDGRDIFEKYEIEFGDKKILLPESIIMKSEIFDIAIDCCSKVANDLAKDPTSETKESLTNFLKIETPDLRTLEDYESILESLWEYTVNLSVLIKEQADSIWAYIIRNNYRPTMFKGQFDYIIGNPPWLSYRYIEDPKYQKEVKELAVNTYAVAPKKQKLMTQMEIATIFLLHSIQHFGREGDSKIAFVMPRSIFNAEQHKNFRLEKFSGGVSVYQYWDLKNVSPLFNVPSCVAFLENKRRVKSSYDVLEFHGNLINNNMPWVKAKKHLKLKKDKLRIIYLGSNSALSSGPGYRTPTNKGQYIKRFHQGATVVPRNFYFVNILNNTQRIDPSGIYNIETDQEQAKEAKRPYKEILLNGKIEGRFLGYTILAKHILPFFTLNPSQVVLPVNILEDGFFSIRKAKDLKKAGFRYASKWFTQTEKYWDEKREEKAKIQNVYQWLDYRKKLTAQSSRKKHLILYNAAGTHVAASYFKPNSLDSWTVVDAKAYWYSCISDTEAYYLLAILNSSIPNEMIKPFQSLGLMGQRDIHKKILSFPFPLFDKGDDKHIEIAEKGREAYEKAKIVVDSIPKYRSVGKVRSIMREELSKEIKQIDKKVLKLLKLHESSITAL